jgi:signal transduction histidine kinase
VAILGPLLLALALLILIEITESQPEYLPTRELILAWQENSWRITWVHPVGSIYDSGLHSGDSIVAADDRPLTAADEPTIWLDQADTLTIERDGERQELTLVEPQAFGLGGRLAYTVAGSLFVLVGAYTWGRGGGGRVQTSFLALCSLVGLVLLTAPAAQRGHVWALSLGYLSAVALTALLIFARSFPIIRPLRFGRLRLAPEWLWLVAATGISLYLLSLAGLIPYESVRLATVIWTVLALLLTIITIGQSWWHARHAEDRRAQVQLAIVGSGAVIGFLPSLLALLSEVITGRFLIDPFLAVPITVLLPVSVAYAMLRYRVMDADLVVRRSITWLVAAALFAGIIAGTSYIISLVPVFNQPLVPNIAAAGLIVLLIPLYNWLMRHLDRVVYGRGHDMRQTLTAATRELATTLDEGRLLDLTLERVLETLQPSMIVIFERCGQGSYHPIAWQRRYEARSAPPPPPLSPTHPGMDLLLASRSWQAQSGAMSGDAAVLLVPASAPLGEEERDAGASDGPPWLLGLAPRPSGLPYSSEDIALLEVLAQGLAAALANARHYGQLRTAYAELHTAQMQLLQAAKLAAIGEVASGITHELNQPLTVLRGRLQRLIVSTDSESVRPELLRMEQQTHKMMQIVAHMRSFARVSRDERQPIALNHVVAEALQLLGQQLRAHGIETITKLHPDLPPVLGDAGQLEQVLINLLSNARDAVSGLSFPRITIITEPVAEMPGWLRLTVADNGAGIAAETLPHIFDPFFTTKEEGKGTGLGLSISRGIIERHGGRLEVESVLDNGSTFRILLPSAELAITAPAASDDTAA